MRALEAGSINNNMRNEIPSIQGISKRAISSDTFMGLTRLVKQIKARHPGQRQAYLVADRSVPYGVLIRTMDAIRGVVWEGNLSMVDSPISKA